MRGLLAIACVCLCASHSAGALLLYDGFDYPVGEGLASHPDPDNGDPNGQLNVEYNEYWRYAGNTNNEALIGAPHIVSGSLSVPGMPAPTGNSVGFDQTKNAQARIAIPGGPVDTGDIYWSAFLRANDLNNLNMGDGINPDGVMTLAALNNSTGPGGQITAFGSVLFVQRDQSDPEVLDRYRIGGGVNLNPNSRAFASESLEEGETVFVVLGYTHVPGSNNDEFRMWINPDPSDFGGLPPTPDVSVSHGGGAELGQAASFVLRNVQTVGQPDIQFDELRIGTTWGAVTIPEPSSLLLLLIGFGFVQSMRRRAPRQAGLTA